jgi:hypothetical protein
MAFPFCFVASQVQVGLSAVSFKKGLRVPRSLFKKDAATIPNAGATSITISKFKVQNSKFKIQSSKFVIQHSLFFIYLNFLMVQKPYIPLYSLYGKKLISITISKFNIQHSLFNIPSSITFQNLLCLIWFKKSAVNFNNTTL